jgi:large subunit ribosomal protein L21
MTFENFSSITWDAAANFLFRKKKYLLSANTLLRRDHKNMYAIIVTGGKQYKVSEGDTLKVEKLEAAEDTELTFEPLLIADGEKITAGMPTVSGAKVTAKVVKPLVKGEKILVFKYKAKKNVRKRKGHRQKYSELKIEKIAVQ